MKQTLIATTCILALAFGSAAIAQTGSGSGATGSAGTSAGSGQAQGGTGAGTKADQSGTTGGVTTGDSGTGTTTGASGSGTKSNAQTGQSSSGSAGETTGSTGKAGSGASDLSDEQRTEISRSISHAKVKRVDTDVSVSVGAAVPVTVELYSLPPDVVTVVPQYSGYRYFVLADGRIVIVDPATLMVVTILNV